MQCAQRLSLINLLSEIGWQRRMEEISKSGATGGGRDYGLWLGLRHWCNPERDQKLLLPEPSVPRRPSTHVAVTVVRERHRGPWPFP